MKFTAGLAWTGLLIFLGILLISVTSCLLITDNKYSNITTMQRNSLPVIRWYDQPSVCIPY